MTYPNLLRYYIAQGGEGARETAFGVPSWDAAADPHREHPVAVRFNHHNRDVLAVTEDGRVALVGTVTADADPAELALWFQDFDGTWPLRSLQEIRERINEINGRFEFMELADRLPRCNRDAKCRDCGRPAHRIYGGGPICMNCLLRRRGNP